jgi:hypothetical protein
MILLSSAYLAPVEYYRQMNRDGHVIIEQHDNYVKRTWRNRCTLATANGLQQLSIPVEKPAARKCPMKDVRIAQHGRWQHLHWNAIVSAYNSSPFLEYYADDFRPFFEKRFDFLFDFNEALRETVCSLLDISPAVEYSQSFVRTPPPGTVDMRDSVPPEACTAGSRPYYQVFAYRNGFQPDLSIVDLLFNMGTEALLYLT